MSRAITLSVLIVTWQVRDVLRDCLRSLARTGLLDRPDAEILLVDNASDDGTVEMVRAAYPQIRCLAPGENLGFGQANNLGLAKASGRYVLLLNPDTLVGDGAVDRMLDRMEGDPSIAVLGCRLINADGSLQRWTAGSQPTLRGVAGHYLFLNRLLGAAHAIYLPHDVQEDREVGWVCGACMMLRRAAIPDPAFDPRFFLYGEDVDLCARVVRAGHRVVYTPASCITHLGGASMRQQGGMAMTGALMGMRTVYASQQGGRWLWLFDLLTIAGFAWRSALFALGGRLAAARIRLGFTRAAWSIARGPQQPR